MNVELLDVAGDDAGPYAVCAGPDGNLWVTLVHAGAVARVTPGGEVTRHALDDPAARPTIIVPGPDGALWFSRFGDGRLGRVTVDGDMGTHELPWPDGGPFGLATGPDGALWYTAANADAVGRVGGGVWATPGFPSTIVTGPDGAVWFTCNRSGELGRLTADGEVTVEPAGDAPVGIAADADAVWWVDIAADRVRRRAMDGTVRTVALPAGARPHAIAADGAGGCFVTEWGAHRLGHVTRDGAYTGRDLPAAAREPHGLAVTAGAVWVACETGQLARFTR
ncbi:Vgb family protein [Spirilliplanes yamanashiensis]|uniref:Virginiamycin B lyase n=1 Tax=Spirilliplanes yamanashiensis TaxID=42233 RepID=A0A8J3YCG1_9ACTN|nr:virginiamycin B lyase [Spirilliplanes yamanashiensis]MDP9818895.1 virginiamycin B lyase [Spirilliplanes yamanashiensis]GIJ05349.1 virginiamycin B lyase [Spirilliplanes yamanashiensis]